MPAKPPKPLVKFEKGVLSVQLRRLWETFPVSSIIRVVGFKKDYVTLDVVFWEITFADGSVVHIHEDVPGFKEATAGLAEALGINEALIAMVVYPAFEENRTVLFERNA